MTAYAQQPDSGLIVPQGVMPTAGDVTANIDLYDQDFKNIINGPLAWYNEQVGHYRSWDDVYRELLERFHQIGLKVTVSLWTYSETPGGKEVPNSFMFNVQIDGRVDPHHEFDFDQFTHEIQNNLLEIPGEGGKIKMDKRSEREFLRRHGGGHGH